MHRLLLAAALFAASPALAQSYLTPKQVDLIALLPPPPAPGSALNRAELQEVLTLQAARTPEQAAATVHDAEETVFAMFGELMGPSFTPASLPLASKLFDRLGDVEEDLTDPAKKAFARKRPFQADDAVHPSAPLSKSGSYPSGHATRVTIMGIVLGVMVPEKRDAIFARAADYQRNRVVGGVHYASDIEAGDRAGTAAAAVLMNDPAFEADFGPAKAELRKALGVGD